MILADYIKFVPTTAVFPEEITDFGHAYLFLGLLSELDELDDALRVKDMMAVAKECGDCLWYITNGLLRLGYEPESYLRYTTDTFFKGRSPQEYQGMVNNAIKIVAKYAGCVKKHYRDTEEMIHDIEECYQKVGDIVHCIHTGLGFQTPDILEINYQKLSKRLKNSTLQGSGDNR